MLDSTVVNLGSNPNLTVDLEYSYFQAGKAVRQADGSDTHFGMVSTTFRF